MALEYASGKSEASFLVHSCKTESDVRLVLPHCLPRRDDLTVEVGKAHQIIIDKDVSIHAPHGKRRQTMTEQTQRFNHEFCQTDLVMAGKTSFSSLVKGQNVSSMPL